MGFINSRLSKIYAKLTNSGEIDNIKTYRKALIRELEVDNLSDSIIKIDFDNVCDDYSKCLELFSGTSHLSKKGNEKFSQVIINELIKNIGPSNK
jgi:hypothetical protein